MATFPRTLLLLALTLFLSPSLNAARRPDPKRVAREEQSFNRHMATLARMQQTKFVRGKERPLRKKNDYIKDWDTAKRKAKDAAEDMKKYGGRDRSGELAKYRNTGKQMALLVIWVDEAKEKLEKLQNTITRLERNLEALIKNAEKAKKTWTAKSQPATDAKALKARWEKFESAVSTHNRKLTLAKKAVKQTHTPKTLASFEALKIRWLTPQELAQKYIDSNKALVQKLRSGKSYTEKVEKAIKKKYRENHAEILKLGARPGDLPTPDDVDSMRVGSITRRQAVTKYLLKMEAYEKEAHPTKPTTMLRSDFEKLQASYLKARKKAQDNMHLYDNLTDKKQLISDWKTRLKGWKNKLGSARLEPGENLTLTSSKNASDADDIKRTEDKLKRYIAALKKDDEYAPEEQATLLSKYREIRDRFVKDFPRTASEFPAAEALHKGTPTDTKQRTDDLIQDLETAEKKLTSGTLDEDAIKKYTSQYKSSYKGLARVNPDLAKRYSSTPPAGVEQVSDSNRIKDLIKKINAINKKREDGVTEEEARTTEASYYRTKAKVVELIEKMPAATRPTIPNLGPADTLSPADAVEAYRKRIDAIDSEIKLMNEAERARSALKDKVGAEAQLKRLMTERSGLVRRIRTIDPEAAKNVPDTPEAGSGRKPHDLKFWKSSKQKRAKKTLSAARKTQASLDEEAKQIRTDLRAGKIDKKTADELHDQIEEERAKLDADMEKAKQDKKGWWARRQDRQDAETAHRRAVELQHGPGANGSGSNVGLAPMAAPMAGVGAATALSGGMPSGAFHGATGSAGTPHSAFAGVTAEAGVHAMPTSVATPGTDDTNPEEDPTDLATQDAVLDFQDQLGDINDGLAAGEEAREEAADASEDLTDTGWFFSDHDEGSDATQQAEDQEYAESLVDSGAFDPDLYYDDEEQPADNDDEPGYKAPNYHVVIDPSDDPNTDTDLFGEEHGPSQPEYTPVSKTPINTNPNTSTSHWSSTPAPWEV